MPFIGLGKFPVFTLLRVYSMNGCWILSFNLYVDLDGHMVLVFYSVNMGYRVSGFPVVVLLR